MSGVIAICAGRDQIASDIAPTIAPCKQVLGSASKHRCSGGGNTCQFGWRAIPHLDPAVPAATLLVDERVLTQDLDLGRHEDSLLESPRSWYPVMTGTDA